MKIMQYLVLVVNKHKKAVGVMPTALNPKMSHEGVFLPYEWLFF